MNDPQSMFRIKLLYSHSTITNSVAYCAIALDFEIWANCRPDIQTVHLGHFAILLKQSRYRVFNSKQRISKFGVIRKLLFVLQADWYPQDIIAHLIGAIRDVAQACFSADHTIKPIVSYLASNLHDGKDSIVFVGARFNYECS